MTEEQIAALDARVASLEELAGFAMDLLRASGTHQPTCGLITSSGTDACNCWIA